MPENHHPAFSKPYVIINQAAGSTADITDEVKAIFAEHLDTIAHVALVDPSELKHAIQTALDGGADLIVSYGGDGTARTLAIAAARNDIAFIPLPGGTMNMLCKALYGTDDWEETLKLALSQKKVRWLSAGMIEDQPFYVGSILGRPTLLQNVREKIRDIDLIGAAKDAAEIITAVGGDDLVTFSTNESSQQNSANLLILSCPEMRGVDNDLAEIELAAITTETLIDVAHVGFTALISDFRNDANTVVTTAADITITGDGELNILLDGEHHVMSLPFKISYNPKAVKVLAPTDLK